MGHSAQAAPPRVRDQVREAMMLLGFSAATSVALASGLVLLARLGGQG